MVLIPVIGQAFTQCQALHGHPPPWVLPTASEADRKAASKPRHAATAGYLACESQKDRRAVSYSSGSVSKAGVPGTQ